jgi:hypothetical protein
LILRPDLTIVDASDSYLHATMTWRDEIRDVPLFDVFPGNPNPSVSDGRRNLNASLARMLDNRRRDTMDIQRYDLLDQVSNERTRLEKYWALMNLPVFVHKSSEIVAVIRYVEDVTQFPAAASAKTTYCGTIQSGPVAYGPGTRACRPVHSPSGGGSFVIVGFRSPGSDLCSVRCVPRAAQ